MSHKNFKTLRAYVEELFGKRAQTQDGFNAVTEASVKALADKVDILEAENDDLKKRLKRLEEPSRPRVRAVGDIRA